MVVALIFVLLLAGSGLAVAGVYLLAGMPWALLAGGMVLVAAAFGLRAGLPPHEVPHE
jgi:hypothetical protein